VKFELLFVLINSSLNCSYAFKSIFIGGFKWLIVSNETNAKILEWRFVVILWNTWANTCLFKTKESSL